MESFDIRACEEDEFSPPAETQNVENEDSWGDSQDVVFLSVSQTLNENPSFKKQIWKIP